MLCAARWRLRRAIARAMANGRFGEVRPGRGETFESPTQGAQAPCFSPPGNKSQRPLEVAFGFSPRGACFALRAGASGAPSPGRWQMGDSERFAPAGARPSNPPRRARRRPAPLRQETKAKGHSRWPFAFVSWRRGGLPLFERHPAPAKNRAVQIAQCPHSCPIRPIITMGNRESGVLLAVL